MKIDAKMHRWIDATFKSVGTRNTIKNRLRDEPEPAGVVCSQEINGGGTIGANILVMTSTSVGYGWPMIRVMWKFGAPN
jgi:hypothetical protein